ncbi:MAG: Ig-like domain repeat protein, partial [Candidatus Dormibacteria bacterium]
GGAGSANSDAGFGGGGGGGATEVGAASCAAALSCTLVAGGGGGTGGGGLEASAGGAAGYPAGANGTGADGTTGGGGGTQSAPGAGGDGTLASPGSPGVLNVGGAGTSGGGGGGGGYFGGGGGGESEDNDGTGGGGGSSFAPTGAAFETGALGSIDGGAVIIWATASSLSVTQGDPVTVTADVPFEADGTETFTVGTTTLCSDVPVGESETASCQTTALPVGTDDVTATYTPPDPPDPYAGTTEVLAITVAGTTVPVPTSGAGSPAGVPPVAPLLIVLGCAGILAGTRLHRAR